MRAGSLWIGAPHERQAREPRSQKEKKKYRAENAEWFRERRNNDCDESAF